MQTQLTVNRPGDAFEQEADALADHVMGLTEVDMAEADRQSPPSRLSTIHHAEAESVQRLAADRSPSQEDAVVVDEEEAGQGMAQTLRPPGQMSGAVMVSKALMNGSQGGAPLEGNAQQFMQTRYGADFSHVRVHADSHAASLAHALNARAFTYGRDIFFGTGEYQPATPAGRHVIAHELAHVIQQSGGGARLPVQQKVAAGTPPAIQRLGPLGKAIQHHVAPWGSGPLGSDYEVKTDAGSTISGWQAYFVYSDEFTYWCHGHSLDTYTKYGYSVYSGTGMATVVRDEWTAIKPDQTKVGDIVVWTAGFDHSAKFTKPVIQNGQLMPTSEVSSKNGQNPLTLTTLTALAGTYGTNGVAVFRHK